MNSPSQNCHQSRSIHQNIVWLVQRRIWNAWAATHCSVNVQGRIRKASCCHLHLLSEKRQARAENVFPHIQEIFLGKENCSVISYKWLFMCTASYEETFSKTKKYINIWYLVVFFSIPLFYFWRLKKIIISQSNESFFPPSLKIKPY